MTAQATVDDCRLIQLPRVQDQRGSLTFLEEGKTVPFSFRRVFYLYDIAAGAQRGAHAHRVCEQFILALSGEFSVLLDDGRRKRRERLTLPTVGLYVPPCIWVELSDFSRDSVCLVLASEHYDESEYLRDYAEFLVTVGVC